jgi:hypothetical protein
MIAKNYLKRWFFLDFISLIPFDAIFRNNNYNRLIRYSRIYLIFRVLRFAGLLKLFRFFRIHDKTKKTATYGKLHLKPSNVKMMFLLIYFLIIEHIWTCIWIMIGKVSPESKTNWIYKQDMLDSSNWDLYVAARCGAARDTPVGGEHLLDVPGRVGAAPIPDDDVPCGTRPGLAGRVLGHAL